MQDEHRIRAGGVWLGIASILMALALVLHGPIAPELSERMVRISNHATGWSVAHWIAAAALSLYAVASLIILTTRSNLTGRPSMLSAWAVLLVGGLWTLNTAVAEATVVKDAAVSGSTEMFEAWWAYAEGKASGFSFLALALAFIAARDARGTPGATPSWAAGTAMAGGIGAFMGWALGMWFGVSAGNLLWVASATLMSVWAAWFGFALARSPGTSLPREEQVVRETTHAG